MFRNPRTSICLRRFTFEVGMLNNCRHQYSSSQAILGEAIYETSLIVFHQYRDVLQYYASDPGTEGIATQYGVLPDQKDFDRLSKIIWFAALLGHSGEFIHYVMSQFLQTGSQYLLSHNRDTPPRIVRNRTTPFSNYSNGVKRKLPSMTGSHKSATPPNQSRQYEDSVDISFVTTLMEEIMFSHNISSTLQSHSTFSSCALPLTCHQHIQRGVHLVEPSNLLQNNQPGLKVALSGNQDA